MAKLCGDRRVTDVPEKSSLFGRRVSRVFREGNELWFRYQIEPEQRALSPICIDII